MQQQLTHFERGKREALKTLEAWRSLGFSSREACRQHALAYIKGELAHAEERARVATGTRSQEHWQHHIAYFRGHLAALH